MITKTVNGVHYKESKQAGSCQSFTHVKLLMENLSSSYTVMPEAHINNIVFTKAHQCSVEVQIFAST